MDIRQLEYFVAVAECASFSKAAERQFITQTTISYHISLLEKELGFTLLKRDNKKVELTPAGIEFLDRTKEILNDLRKAEEAARQVYSCNQDVLRVGYFGHSFYHGLPLALEKLISVHPGMRLHVFQKKQSELIRLLERDELDCILCTDYGMFSQISWMNKMSLYADPIRLLVRADHWAAEKDEISIRELEHEKFALLVEKQLFDLNSFPLPDADIIYADSHDDLILLVKSGYAVSMGAEHALENDDHELKLVPFSDYLVYDNNFFCWKSENRKKVLKDLIDILNCTNR